ncbi:FAD-dependent oxidoreductase [Spirosoma sp. KUDC1026]|uniref:FAD-dependent oxidoreductase n=1 Tax=Spirosoma sp. KUDC1026 TaxID=2745947 RepID=UPI00159BDE75|nr:FAD-dependent oxidoreductase [Spirosoma sp. KUDC1026]QKZ14843.1 FAD-dependent oxidoreductase [Spirosoma sp. KUDC1026]
MTTNYTQTENTYQTTCCIVGGGPAGMMLGFLLARAGVAVTVLEKHADFLRDFRGDTIHPTTLELLYELGLIDEFLQQPHQELHRVSLAAGPRVVPMAEFSDLPVHKPFIVFMPQWDFLNFLSAKARQFPSFTLLMETEMTDLISTGGKITGVRASSPTGEVIIRADLVVGTDGRHSRVREKAGMIVQDFGAPIDVLWMRISKDTALTEQALAYVYGGKFMVLIDRHDYFQCGYLIPKGQFNAVKQQGLPALQENILKLAPFVGEYVRELDSWDKISLLTVKIDRLKKWYRPGLLCIGDAAHAMSPAGGVGVNLAIQDAVAAARYLAGPLQKGNVSDTVFERIQRRRTFPVRVIQRAQIFAHRYIANAEGGSIPPFVFWLMDHVPALRRLIGRMVGMGPRPEFIQDRRR